MNADRASVSDKIARYRHVRAEIENAGNGDSLRLPTKDGTPLSRKMFVETFCVAQARIGNSPLDKSRAQEHIARLQVLIDIFQDRGEE